MNEREEQLAALDVEARDEARMNDYLLAPDPGGLNRALDRAAAEHLRAVAPHLAPCLSCRAGLCAEHGPTVTATTTTMGCGTLTPTPRMLPHSISCIRGHGCVPGCTGVGPIPLHPGQAGYEEELLAKAAAPNALCAECRDHADGVWAASEWGWGICPNCGKRAVAYFRAPDPPAEAKGEMTPPHGIRCDRCLAGVPHERDRHCYSIAQLMEHIAALRTSAREAEERAEKWRSELSAACELSERYRSIVTEALNQPPEYWYDKHDNGEWSASHAAFAIAALFRERDEAREQREDLANEILAERSDLAAANARAEEAERDTRTAAEACDEALRQRDTERAARVAAETEREAYRQDRDLTAHRLAAAEAEVKRLREKLTDSYDEVQAWRGEVREIRAAAGIPDGELVTGIAALRARVARLEEAGDAMASGNLGLADMRARWAAAKADATAKAETPRT